MTKRIIDKLQILNGRDVNVRFFIDESLLKVVVSTPKLIEDPPLDASAVDLELAVGFENLTVIEAPSGILPETRLKGATAHALYTFDFPAASRTKAITEAINVRISFEGDTKELSVNL